MKKKPLVYSYLLVFALEISTILFISYLRMIERERERQRDKVNLKEKKILLSHGILFAIFFYYIYSFLCPFRLKQISKTYT